MMKYKWIIKRVKDDPIYCSQSVGEQALAAWKRGVAVISLPGIPGVSTASISAIEETFIPEDPPVALPDGNSKATVEPVFDLEGNVMTGWYKMQVGQQAWEKKYSLQPNYYKLVDEDNGVWAAMRLPEYSGDFRRGEGVQPCEHHEIRSLERRIA